MTVTEGSVLARLDNTTERSYLALAEVQAELDVTKAEADSLGARIANQREQVVVAGREINVRRTRTWRTPSSARRSGAWPSRRTPSRER